MKKYLNFAFAYAVLAMAGGVFYREFTKWNAFTGATALGKVHTHLFILGMFLFLIVALFAGRGDGLERYKSFRAFLYLYNVGLPLTAVMMVARDGALTGLPAYACVNRMPSCAIWSMQGVWMKG